MAKLKEKLHDALASNAERFVLIPSAGTWKTVEAIEAGIGALRGVGKGIQLEGFGPPRIFQFSQETGVAPKEIVSRIVSAGIDSLPSFGGGMLIDRVMKERGITTYTAEEWLSIMRWAHRCGANSSSCLLIGKSEGWEERIIHLKKLRTLQDETGGFQFHSLQIAPSKDEGVDVALKLRATAITRLFLDNIPSLVETETDTDPTRSLLSLCFGGDQVQLEDGDRLRDTVKKTLKMFQQISSSGFDMHPDVVGEVGDRKPVH
jgi:2-iminoacetate synthase ThiH